MCTSINKCFYIYSFVVIILLIGCKENKSIYFETLNQQQTGLTFNNKLTSYPDFNMFKYMYFFNGAGVGAGDFNNDGLIDLYFASNQGKNKLFLNKGKLKFDDVTDQTGIPFDSAWSTGVSVVDINADGLLDIYVSRVGNFERLQSKNQFLICTEIENGIPHYTDKAPEMGLDFSSFGTQAAFLDYDLDGDLDVYIMNHSLRYNGTFFDRSKYENTRNELSGDRLLKNENGVFIDASEEAGIRGTIIGYGLGICVADINMDGLPDIYIGNDFHENDYMYINNGDGTFDDKLTSSTQQTSQFSMGVDIADITNDGLPEIITMDMLPSDPYLLRRSLGEDSYDLFNHKLKAGYHHQYARNTLQLNRGNMEFSEIGRYSGVHATDWSWSSLFLDFDNDGSKDLFVTNGIPKRMNDIDYIKFISDESFQNKIKENRISENELKLVNQFPEIKVENVFYKNIGNAKFDKLTNEIKNNKKTFSNGAVYADFDNDGDIDIVVNNIDDYALLYENKSNDNKLNKSIKISLKGPIKNLNALGAKILVYDKDKLSTYENYNVRGFMSSSITPINIGLGSSKPDSIMLIWPDNTFQRINLDNSINVLKFEYVAGLPKFDYGTILKNDKSININDITDSTGLNHIHRENPFIEFNREPLIPHMVSREGPAVAVVDVNNDNLDDFYIGSSKFDTSYLYLQTKEGRFIKSNQPAFEKDNNYEDVDATFADLNGDGYNDLIVASGGNEYSGNSPMLNPRVYFNDGNGLFIKAGNAISSEILLTASTVSVFDINNDNKLDLFFGARAVPREYGQLPQSYLLLNNGKGQFILDKKNSEKISSVGFITSSTVADLNNDGKNELFVSTEWNGIYWFENTINGLQKNTVTNLQGWWNTIYINDLDNDNDLDIVAGNLGLNNKFNVSEKTPIGLYFDDFDNNGTKEQILTYFVEGKEICFNNHEELLKQIPILKKRYLFAADFAKCSVQDIIGIHSNKLIKSQANNLGSFLFENDGKNHFSPKELPYQTQLSPIKSILQVNYNNDDLPDLLLAGNYYHNNIQMGRYDADYGCVLLNKGNLQFEYLKVNNKLLNNEIRKLSEIKIKNKSCVLVGINNDAVKVLTLNK